MIVAVSLTNEPILDDRWGTLFPKQIDQSNCAKIFIGGVPQTVNPRFAFL